MPAAFTQPSTTCAACNRFIGINLECPYCGIESTHRAILRGLQISAFTLSIAGLVILFTLSVVSPTPKISISKISPLMNHGRVTLAGTIIDTPWLNGPGTAAQSITFDLAYPGGQLQIIAPKGPARMMLSQDGLPAAQQFVEVTGKLYFSAGRTTRLYLDSSPALIRESAIQ